MKYNIDCTDSYEYLIDFDNLSGIKNYSSLPEIDQETLTCRVHLENVSVNMYDKIWRDQILSINIKSKINIDEDLIILAKKAKFIIENIRCYDLMVIHNEYTYFYSSGLRFNTKDRHISLGGYDIEHLDSNIYSRVIFKGNVFLELEEENIIPLMIGCDDQIGYKCVQKINDEKETEVMKKNKLIDFTRFNSIRSSIWEFDFFMDYFATRGGYHEAIKSYV